MKKNTQKPEKPPQNVGIANPIIIMTNEQGQAAIHKLCDIALKVEGLNGYSAITNILRSIKPLPQPKQLEENKNPAEVIE